MNTIDGWIGTIYNVPFNPWLHVSSVDGSDLTVDWEDVGFLTVGDTIAFYDNSEQKLGQSLGTVAGIADNIVTITGLTGIAADDEICVYTDVAVATSRNRRIFGPPPEVNARALDVARYYGHTDITTLQDATDPVVKAYESAVEWGTLIREGTADLTGAAAVTVGYMSTYDIEPAINLSGPSTWGFDRDHPAQSEDRDKDPGLDP
ncbi:MAG: DUF1320 domain-containing protein [Methanophagales archaeon]|nr:DUF1320 domain-containing protein [Methanophagales archaeon]